MDLVFCDQILVVPNLGLGYLVLLYIFLLVASAGLFWALAAAAPYGWEDEEGFHLGMAPHADGEKAEAEG